MDVNVEDHQNTHAVVGGSKAGSLGISADGGLMRNLTISLYRYPMVAAFREPLSNGWDAHIDSGKTDKPLKVEISDDEVTIRDHGKGMPHEQVPFIYGTYGHSTKSKDQKQTGGFGLGSKAPMAYATNFTVECRHKGKLSIWNFSRGSADTDGKPDYRKIIEVPCQKRETGITVKIPIVKHGDPDKIRAIIKEIAYVGGIKLQIGSRPAGYINYDEIEKEGLPFILVPKERIPAYLREENNRGPQYLVRLGTVLYPAPEVEGQPLFYGRKMNLVPGHYAVVFIAKGGTMNMTPARETLNMTSMTEQTFKELFDLSKKWIKDNIEDCIEKAAVKFHGMLTFEGFTDVDDISMAWANITQGYTYILEKGAYNYHSNDSHGLLKTQNDIKNQFAEYIAGRGEYKREIAMVLEKTDPSQEQFKEQLIQSVKKHHPLIEKMFLKYLRNLKASSDDSRNRRSHRIVSNIMGYHICLRTYRWLDHLSGLDGAVSRIVSKRHSISQQSALDFHAQTIGRRRYSIDYDSTQVLNAIQRKSGYRVQDFPILVAQSDASIERVLKAGNHDLDISHDSVYIKVVCRSRKDYEAALAYLRDTIKCKKLLAVPDYDLIPKPKKSLETLRCWKIARTEQRDRRGNYKYHQVSEIIKDEDRSKYKHFIMSPRAQLFAVAASDKRNKAKLDIEQDILYEIAQEYPDLVVVPMADEARLLEKEGMVNVLEDIASRAKEFISDPSNTERIFVNFNTFSRFTQTYRQSILMGILSPSEILEGLGHEPTYDTSLVGDVPNVVKIFADLAKQNHNSTCGMQYIHNAAEFASKMIAKYFGDDLREILTNSTMGVFLDAIPRKFSNNDEKENVDIRASPLIRSAVLAAMQTARVHISLAKIETKS